MVRRAGREGGDVGRWLVFPWTFWQELEGGPEAFWGESE